MLYIGIDTGVNTGVAVWDNRKRSFALVKTMKIHEAMELVRETSERSKAGNSDRVVIRVEDPRQRTWFGTERMSREEERKKLQGVGSVKRDATIWEDFLKDLGVPYEMVAPKRNKTKLTSRQFKQITGWETSTNEHNRDAAMLVFGF